MYHYEKEKGREMKINRGLFTTILVIVVFLASGIMSVNATTNEGKTSEETVTRLEWLKALTVAFEMEVEEDNYPDNYYSDIDATSSDYYDVMLGRVFKNIMGIN